MCYLSEKWEQNKYNKKRIIILSIVNSTRIKRMFDWTAYNFLSSANLLKLSYTLINSRTRVSRLYEEYTRVYSHTILHNKCKIITIICFIRYLSNY